MVCPFYYTATNVLYVVSVFEIAHRWLLLRRYALTLLLRVRVHLCVYPQTYNVFLLVYTAVHLALHPPLPI